MIGRWGDGGRSMTTDKATRITEKKISFLLKVLQRRCYQKRAGFQPKGYRKFPENEEVAEAFKNGRTSTNLRVRVTCSRPES